MRRLSRRAAVGLLPQAFLPHRFFPSLFLCGRRETRVVDFNVSSPSPFSCLFASFTRFWPGLLTCRSIQTSSQTLSSKELEIAPLALGGPFRTGTSRDAIQSRFERYLRMGGNVFEWPAELQPDTLLAKNLKEILSLRMERDGLTMERDLVVCCTLSALSEDKDWLPDWIDRPASSVPPAKLASPAQLRARLLEARAVLGLDAKTPVDIVFVRGVDALLQAAPSKQARDAMLKALVTSLSGLVEDGDRLCRGYGMTSSYWGLPVSHSLALSLPQVLALASPVPSPNTPFRAIRGGVNVLEAGMLLEKNCPDSKGGMQTTAEYATEHELAVFGERPLDALLLSAGGMGGEPFRLQTFLALPKQSDVDRGVVTPTVVSNEGSENSATSFEDRFDAHARSVFDAPPNAKAAGDKAKDEITSDQDLAKKAKVAFDLAVHMEKAYEVIHKDLVDKDHVAVALIPPPHHLAWAQIIACQADYLTNMVRLEYEVGTVIAPNLQRALSQLTALELPDSKDKKQAQFLHKWARDYQHCMDEVLAKFVRGVEDHSSYPAQDIAAFLDSRCPVLVNYPLLQHKAVALVMSAGLTCVITDEYTTVSSLINSGYDPSSIAREEALQLIAACSKQFAYLATPLSLPPSS